MGFSSSKNYNYVPDYIEDIIWRVKSLEEKKKMEKIEEISRKYKYNKDERQRKIANCIIHLTDEEVDQILNSYTIDKDALLTELKKRKEHALIAHVEDYFMVGNRLPQRLTKEPKWHSYEYIDDVYCRNLLGYTFTFTIGTVTIQPKKKYDMPTRYTQTINIESTVDECISKLKNSITDFLCENLKFNNPYIDFKESSIILELHFGKPLTREDDIFVKKLYYTIHKSLGYTK